MFATITSLDVVPVLLAQNTLGFGDEAGSCRRTEQLTRAYLANEIEATCPNHAEVRAECRNDDGCVNCLWVPDNSATVSCFDGCLYRLGEWTVQRGYSISRAVGYLNNNAVLIIVSALWMKFTEGSFAGTTFRMTREAGRSCSVSFNNMDCPCELVYCDEQRESYHAHFDCSAVPGGMYMNFCNPPTVEIRDDLTVMELLLFIPALVCGGSQNGPLVDPLETSDAPESAVPGDPGTPSNPSLGGGSGGDGGGGGSSNRSGLGMGGNRISLGLQMWVLWMTATIGEIVMTG